MAARSSMCAWVCAIAVTAAVSDATGDSRVEIPDSMLVQVATEGPHDSVTVGQRFPIVYKVYAPDSLTFVAPTKIDAGDCRVVSIAWSEAPRNGAVERTANVVMVAVELDSVAVPPVPFDFVAPSGDTLRGWSDGVEVPIKRIALASKDVRPLKSQWEVPPDYVKWALIALAGLALVAAIVWWIRRRRRRVIAAAPEVRLPPDYVALSELEKIAGMGLIERGELKEYYTLVADVVRRYLGARFDVETLDRTTHELLGELAHRRISVDGLGALLDEADLVKFAKFHPDITRAESALERARRIVVETTPREVAPAVGTGTEA